MSTLVSAGSALCDIIPIIRVPSPLVETAKIDCSSCAPCAPPAGLVRHETGQAADTVITPDHFLWAVLPTGRRMTRPVSLSMVDRNGRVRIILRPSRALSVGPVVRGEVVEDQRPGRLVRLGHALLRPPLLPRVIGRSRSARRGSRGSTPRSPGPARACLAPRPSRPGFPPKNPASGLAGRRS